MPDCFIIPYLTAPGKALKAHIPVGSYTKLLIVSSLVNKG
jgi:hypothetical protein